MARLGEVRGSGGAAGYVRRYCPWCRARNAGNVSAGVGDSSRSWASGPIEAAEEWLRLQPGSPASGGWTRRGEARPAAEPGWLALDLRERPGVADSIEAPVCLADRDGPDRSTAYPVEQYRAADGVVLLKIPTGTPAGARWVWTPSISPRFLLEKLVSGLRAVGRAPLAEALAAGDLAGPPARSSPVPPGLLFAQPDAYLACMNPGVRLVWGPPGTGKTQVLARAIEDLMRAGKRVLLVSTANVAVDNALLAVVKAVQLRPGQAIRVGPAHLSDIADRTDLRLDSLTATASADVDARREVVGRRLAELSGVDDEIAELTVQLEGFDPAEYGSAADRVAAATRLADLEPHRSAALRAVEDARLGARGRKHDIDRLARESARLAGPRSALARLSELRGKLGELDGRQNELQLALRTAEALASGATGWGAGRAARRRIQQADLALREFTVANTERRDRLWGLIAENRAVVGTVTPEGLAVLDRKLRLAQRSAAEADEFVRKCVATVSGIEHAMAPARQIGPPTDADRSLVERCDREGRPQHHARQASLQEFRASTVAERTALEEEHRRLIDRSRRLRTDAEAELIDQAGIVATTLARSRVNRAVARSIFDVVLVDEAGAATLAEVLLVLARATTTAVLFGDFLQLGAVLNRPVEDSENPAVRRWVQSTCFSHVKITNPEAAVAHPGCVALLHQFRFGPGLRRLANEVIYQVLRDARELPGIRANPDTEIIVVDVSSVQELAVVRQSRPSGRWWAAGLVLSRALVQQHLPESSGGVGVVTPFKPQAEATLAALRDQDQDLVAGVGCGTVHSFQGREFETVIFDLVEDGQGWVAAGGRTSSGAYGLKGVRLFAVGATRARRRLYVLLDGRALTGATAGPLQALRAALERGDARSWSAAALLGLAEPPEEQVDPAFEEVAELLQQTVTISDISNEVSFGQELERHLVGARESVWMWSPWVSKRADVVVPLIADAVRRGVQVWVFVRPDEDNLMKREWAQRRLPALRGSGATLIRSDHEHRKIVVIDRRTVLFGSLNALSANPGNTRESMLTMDGRAFAERLLIELDAEILGDPQACSGCGNPMEVRGGGKRQKFRWECRTCQTKVPVPDRQQSRRR